MAWQDVAHSLRGAMNAATQETTQVILRSANHQCWRCGRPDQVPTVLHLAFDETCYFGFQASAEPALPYVQELLTVAGHPTASTIKPRYSRPREPATCPWAARRATRSTARSRCRKIT